MSETAARMVDSAANIASGRHRYELANELWRFAAELRAKAATGDGRTQCDGCGKYVWPVTHSCKGIRVAPPAAGPVRGVAMRLGKRTAKLLREAIVLAHVEGARWAGAGGRNGYPADSDVVRSVLGAAANMRENYPTLGRLEEAREADRQMRDESNARIATLMQTPGESR